MSHVDTDTRRARAAKAGRRRRLAATLTATTPQATSAKSSRSSRTLRRKPKSEATDLFGRLDLETDLWRLGVGFQKAEDDGSALRFW
ncbi:hypothetical protein AMELA_G00025810 [Ameiurus melas]|uniref:Uncharacterized protein n=1 Tax=Ameiurus melas TaxID=219545 RepID=A0A7J6BEB3_AMEME|nr:hypothetical protein AMELA_G00025810 [Ameiurus melas]